MKKNILIILVIFIFTTYLLSKSREDFESTQCQPRKPFCCKAMNAPCESCRLGKSVIEICSERPTLQGCPKK